VQSANKIRRGRLRVSDAESRHGGTLDDLTELQGIAKPKFRRT